VEGGIKACEDRQGPGRDDVTYAYLHHILGTADSSTGNFRRAEKALKFALRIWEGCSGAHLDEITSTLNNLGIVYNTLGQYDKAEEQFSTARRLLLDSKGEGADDQDQIQSIRMFEHNLQRLAIHRKPETVKKEELESMIEFFLVRGNWYIGAQCVNYQCLESYGSEELI
jgi:tetratricopeptide (TPR) repeat protein